MSSSASSKVGKVRALDVNLIFTKATDTTTVFSYNR